MSGNTPVSNLPYVQLTDVPDANALSQGLATALDHIVIPKYANSTARDAANTSPIAGDMCYISPFYQSYDSVHGWQIQPGLSRRRFFQTTSQHVTNSATMVNTTGLGIPVTTGHTYKIDGWIAWGQAGTGSTAGIKFGFATPGSNTCTWALHGLGAGNSATVGSFDGALRGSSTPQLGGQTVNTAFNAGHLMGIYICDTTGTLNLQFAQAIATSGSANDAILVGTASPGGWSFMDVERVS